MISSKRRLNLYLMQVTTFNFASISSSRSWKREKRRISVKLLILLALSGWCSKPLLTTKGLFVLLKIFRRKIFSTIIAKQTLKYFLRLLQLLSSPLISIQLNYHFFTNKLNILSPSHYNHLTQYNYRHNKKLMAITHSR